MKQLACLAAIVSLGLGCSSIEEPRQILPSTTTPTFTLYVSNQSFDIDPVDIEVFLDNELAVTGDFLVEGQHSWHEFTFKLTPGQHTLSATTTAGGVNISDSINIDGPKFGVLNFWFYPDTDFGSEITPEQFSYDTYDERPIFQ